MLRSFLLLAALIGLSACQTVSAPPSPQPAAPNTPRLSSQQAIANFREVVARVEPVAEQTCRAETPNQNCDFIIALDDDPASGINAFQTLRGGQPYIVFTVGLIADVRNQDELAFVMGHEAAHHIARHIPQQQASAQSGALIFGVLATLSGANQAVAESAAQIGATVGARRFSQDHELEADALGSVIACRAGYNALRGSEYFTRLPDPGDRFLGTHPPNAARIETVRQMAARGC